jgi:tetratricopeptide (TPR) repeat protein
MVAMVLNFRQSQQHSRRSVPAEPDPADIDMLASRAANCAGKGELAEAMRSYQLALLLDEERADLWFQYGTLQRRLGQLGDAIESFEFALRLDPAMYAARCNLAIARQEIGQPLEALQQFLAVTKERPGYLPAWLHAVQLHWALGHHAEAERVAREGMAHLPGNEALAKMLERVVRDRGEVPTVL